MPDDLIVLLTQRYTDIVKRQAALAPLLAEYQSLREEWRHISAVLQKYGALPSGEGSAPSGARDLQRNAMDAAIQAVLRLGGSYSSTMLAQKMNERFGTHYTQSAVASVLRRGAQEGWYTKQGSKWSLGTRASA